MDGVMVGGVAQPSDLAIRQRLCVATAEIHQVTVDLDAFVTGMLFAVEAVILRNKRTARRASPGRSCSSVRRVGQRRKAISRG